HSSCTAPSPTDSCPLSLHDALPILDRLALARAPRRVARQAQPGAGPMGLHALGAHRAGVPLGLARRQSEPLHPPCPSAARFVSRSEEHTSELQSRFDLVCRLLLEKK